MSDHASGQTLLKGLPMQSGLLPRITRKASLKSVVSSGPQTRDFGKREASIICTAVLSCTDHCSGGPRGVCVQSKFLISAAESPAPGIKYNSLFNYGDPLHYQEGAPQRPSCEWRSVLRL